MRRFYTSIFFDKYGNAKVQGLNTRLFYVGLLIKIVLGCTLASSYLTDLFAPFINYFVQSGFQDPYQYFIANGTGSEFPYPPFMLWIMALPRIIFSPLLGDHLSWLHLLVYRLPLLFFDFIILLVLLRWIKTNHRKVLIYYWLSPILIYINYIHGQLDIIPIGLLIISLYLLFKHNWLAASLFLALSICTKTNMVIVLPFFILYIAKLHKLSFWDYLLCALVIGFVLQIINLPYISSASFRAMVYNNPVQQRIFEAYYPFSGNFMYLFIPGSYIILFLRLLSFRSINKDLLIMFLAFSFGVFTVFVAPMQGWYYWIIPFFVYFVIKQNMEQKAVFWLLNLFYFAFFAVIPQSDYLSVFSVWFPGLKYESIYNVFHISDNLVNIIFTLLQTVLVIFLVALYWRGIKQHLDLKISYKPFLIGVGGDSGAGKSTFTALVEQVFGSDFTTVIRGDDMHKWERGNDNWKRITHLNPKANDLHKDLEDIRKLKEGYSVLRKHYDHQEGRFTLPFEIKSNKLVMFEGLHPFYLANHAALYDLKVFIKPDESIRIARKLQRDVVQRGKTTEGVMTQIEERREDSDKYIKGQEKYADMVFSFIPAKQDTDKEALEITLVNDIPLDHLIVQLSANGNLDIVHEFTDDEKQLLRVEGSITKNAIELIAYDEIPELEDIGIYNSEWQGDYNGIIQLLLLQGVFYKMKNH